LILLLCVVCRAQSSSDTFIQTENGHFIRNGKPYYYIGTNFWYGPILASDGRGGDMARLTRELDSLKAIGIDNLRVLAGADAGSDNVVSVKPYLQPEPGVLNDTLLIGLDRFLMELGKRDMVAVVYLNNSWDWSGGYGFYLKHAGKGDSPFAGGDGYGDYVNYASEFVKNDKAKELFYEYVRKMVSRKNSITGKPYTEDPAIMAWQVGNEPRSFSRDGKEKFADFVLHTAEVIKSIDKNHMVSCGSEGYIGCENDMKLYSTIHMGRALDYLTIHIWPGNWGWCTKVRMREDLPYVYQKTTEYINQHLIFAKKVIKPLVIEEFGYPRDKNSYDVESTTIARNAFYDYIFAKIVDSKQYSKYISGCNFWGWGGSGRPAEEKWKEGDDYLCDPPHEPQGWYSVFDSDTTTISVIKNAIKKIKEGSADE